MLKGLNVSFKRGNASNLGISYMFIIMKFIFIMFFAYWQQYYNIAIFLRNAGFKTFYRHTKTLHVKSM